jgi:hypothetical protein
MSLTVQLGESARGPGHAILRIAGWSSAPEATELSIQRNQDRRYLGHGGEWSATPVGHLLTGMSRDGDALIGPVGPSVVDALLATPNAVFRVELRAGATLDGGVLRMVGQLLGSNAAGSGAPLDAGGLGGFILGTEPVTAAEPEAQRVPEPEPPRPSEPDADAPPRIDLPVREAPSPRQRRRTPRLALAALLVVLLLAAATVWQWRRGGWPFGAPPTATQASAAAPMTAPAGACDASAVAQGGDLDFVQKCLASSPAPADIVRAADAAIAAGHCDAARRLYVHVAQGGDPAAATAYARKFDPDGFVPNACFDKPDPETAAYWYEAGAAAGDAHAQRQLGKYLVRQHASGYEHDRGVKLLQAAADSGDAEARQRLAALPKEGR